MSIEEWKKRTLRCHITWQTQYIRKVRTNRTLCPIKVLQNCVIIESRGINIQHGKKERVRLKIESIRISITA